MSTDTEKKAPAVVAKGLLKCFSPKKGRVTRAVDGIDLAVPSGGLTALVGPDGAGKTTLMRLICGLMDRTEGELSVLGLDPSRAGQAVQDQLSYMPQKFGLYEDLTVQENLDLYADLHGVPKAVRRERFTHLLDMTGMGDFTARLAGALSGGMKQKLGLACTLVRAPELLLLDEPTVGVDPLSRRELWQILQQMVDEDHLTVFVSTAYMDEAALCERVYVMNRGRFLAEGTPDEVCHLADGLCYEASGSPLPLRVLQMRFLAEKDVLDAVPSGGVVRLLATGNAEALTKKSGLDGIAIRPVPPRLEDGFMLLLKHDEAADGHKKTPLPAFDKDAVLTTSPESQPVEISVKDLVRKFGDFVAVSHTSFTVHRGEVFGLLGPNGAGKTTTFRMLCGLLPATSGKLSVAGVDLRTARVSARANIGYVAQKFSLYAGLTARDNLTIYGGLYGLSSSDIRRRIAEVAAEFGLTERLDEVPGALPGGYKQRLSMAAALLHQPKILFLDEPTSGIDPLARRTFWQQITALSLSGVTIIITTHFMEEAEYCDRIMIQARGRLLAIGSPSEIREQMGLAGAQMNDVFIAIVERGGAEKEAAV